MKLSQRLLLKEQKEVYNRVLDHLLIQQEFQDISDIVFLNVASVVIPPKSVQQAYFDFTQSYIHNYGENIVTKAWNRVDEARKEIAALIHADSKEIAFVKNTSEGIGIISNGYSFEKGDEVIVIDQEHPSNLFSWIKLQQKGVVLQVVQSRNGEIYINDIIQKVNIRTKAICISAVQFSTGFYVDLKTLGTYCREHNILFIVDGIQAVGRLHIDVREMYIDYLACGGNKGLLGVLGVGFVYCNTRLIQKIVPPYVSYQSIVNHAVPPAITTEFDNIQWKNDARRFESGNLNYSGIIAIGTGAKLLNKLGIENIEKEVLLLDRYLSDKIKVLPLKTRIPKESKNHSGIICVYYPKQKELDVEKIMKKYKIFATFRGGYIRLAIDFYNTKEQMDVVFSALQKISALEVKYEPGFYEVFEK